MQRKESIVDRGTRVVLQKAIQGIANRSEKQLFTMLNLLSKIAPDKDHRQVLESVAKGFKEGTSSFYKTILRMLKTAHPEVVKKIINNLILNEMFFGNKWRTQWRKENNLHPPVFLVISPTYACNLNCKGCYAGLYGNKYRLEYELVQRIIREANEMGIYFFTISGGEPFFWKDLFRMLEEFDDSYFLIYTNGTLINKSVASRLAELGNATPAISIEGYEAETDYRRGSGVFKKIMEAMDNLVEVGVIFGASITHTSVNHDIIISDEFWDMLISKGVAYSWIFQLVPVGKDADDINYMPTPEQRLERYEAITRIRNTKSIMIADFWNDGAYVNGCLAGGAKYLHIDAKGYVEPCVFAHFAVDNIRDKSLKEVLRAPFFRAIRKINPYTKNLLAPCMIIDHPTILRSFTKKYGAVPTHDGAETILTIIKDEVDKRARKWQEISSPVWERDFASKGYKATFGVYCTDKEPVLPETDLDKKEINFDKKE
ncbi:MAG TPA: radical SAM protein, partial [Candidatus Atribacteria bacterium]|nr:radical SAM protein [Candidatus Atribacteria bacterium]